MSGNPAELPAELGNGGGSGTIDWSRIRGGIGGPAGNPPFDARLSAAELVREVLRLRDRINVLEGGALTQRLAPQMMSRSFLGGPNEMPEGEGGGGGGIGVFHPRGEINELPISRFVAEFASLATRFAQFETQVTKQLADIQASVFRSSAAEGCIRTAYWLSAAPCPAHAPSGARSQLVRVHVRGIARA